MSLQYVAVGWNRQKKVYDLILLAGVLLCLGSFVGLGAWLHPNATAETLTIRAFGVTAFLLLHIILGIGPLCRLDKRFLPLLYNRRHLGVTMFFLALVHGTFSVIQFHALGDLNPFVSLLVSNTRFNSVASFPFQQLGLVALAILFLMAATSHDFWLHTLSPQVWKRLHMCAYGVYALLLVHVVFGALQTETNPVLASLVVCGAAVLVSLHILAGLRERPGDTPRGGNSEFVPVCHVDSIPEKRAKVINVDGERIAVFRHDGKVSAISNVCRHQNGPLGEGKIVDGCVTCPWHGYQYDPETGASPPPFKDKVSTFRTRIVDGIVHLDPKPFAPGTFIEPSRVVERTEVRHAG